MRQKVQKREILKKVRFDLFEKCLSMPVYVTNIKTEKREIWERTLQFFRKCLKCLNVTNIC